ncbi:MAG: long-chain fatty acid--CoA ligase [Acidimicrobiia bacterium]|nr:AMP-binding protein [bacterium]MXX01011.1 long-chain fatty acid--CoA ligase [Acidimicrobiia bacterium]MXY74988.1 long-chain fatty acid--CoA ligase [Acidimicrobiia bacterium]MYB77856.1 long-chain fatty acid--CoA ligase [Acidimicrobiia bacterium]
MPALISDLLERSARLYPERRAVAIVGGPTLNYSELHRRVGRVAAVLARAGVGRGDRVGVMAAAGLAFFDAYLGAAWLGAAAVPVATRLAPAEVARQLADAEPRAVIVDAHHGEIVSRAHADAATLIEHDSPEFRRLLSSVDPAPAAALPEDTALIIYTSGTTGDPKGVCLSHAALTFNAFVTAVAQDFRPSDVYLSATPLYHASAGLRVITMLVDGQTHVVLPSFDAEAAMSAIVDEGVTTTIMVATQLHRIMDSPGFDPERFASMRLLLYGASPTGSDLVERMMESLPCSLYHGYGLTEAAAACAGLGAEDHRQGKGTDPSGLSCGRPIVGVDMKIRGPDGREAPPGEVGEILIRTPKLMSGYWRQREATGRAIREGWLHTGDLAHRDRQGYLYLEGRIKELIISGGVNISPSQIEDTLSRHPEVAEAAVIGVPDRLWGEAVTAVVVPRRGASPTLDELARWVGSRLASHMKPKRLVLTDRLPRGDTGKVQKHLLVKRHAEDWAES